MQGTLPSLGSLTSHTHVIQVLVVDPERKRIALTAKKTLVESDLPIIAAFEDAKVGMVTHATVFRVTDKRLQIEFFNNVKGVVPAKEAVYVLHHHSHKLH